METQIYTEMQTLFTDYLTEKKLRRTEERYTIFEHICTFSGHFDMNMLQETLENGHFRVSKATLYNTLEVLVEAGLIVRHPVISKSAQYELKVWADRHLHLICTRCGAIREVDIDTLKTELDNMKLTRFTPEFYCLYIYGLCSKCKYKMQRSMK